MSAARSVSFTNDAPLKPQCFQFLIKAWTAVPHNTAALSLTWSRTQSQRRSQNRFESSWRSCSMRNSKLKTASAALLSIATRSGSFFNNFNVIGNGDGSPDARKRRQRRAWREYVSPRMLLGASKRKRCKLKDGIEEEALDELQFIFRLDDQQSGARYGETRRLGDYALYILIVRKVNLNKCKNSISSVELNDEYPLKNVTAKSWNSKIVYDRNLMKRRFDKTDREVAKLLERSDKHDMSSGSYSKPPGTQRIGSRNRQLSLYLVTEILRKKVMTNSLVLEQWSTTTRKN